MSKIQNKGVLEFTKDIFTLFDQNENLVMAYLYSPFGKKARLQLRQKLNQLLVAKIVEGKPKLSLKKNKVAISLIVSLINARLWDDMRTDFNLTGKEIGQSVAWAIETLLHKLENE